MSSDDRETDNGKAGPKEDEDFLGRWSRLKGESRSTGPVPEPEPTAAPEQNAAVEVEPEPPSDEDLPDPEELDDEADFSAYLSPRVSDGLRKRALRRLFRNPKYNIRDGLDDYTQDYHNFLPLGDTPTADLAGKIAKGLVRKLESGGWEFIEDAEARTAINDPVADPEGVSEPDQSLPGDEAPQETDSDDERDA